MEHKQLVRPFAIKASDEDGTFTGYGSVFDVIDSYRDIILPGAFADTISEHKEKDTAPILLWQHNPDEPIGVWDEVKEDDHGLLMSGRFAMDTQRGREAHSLLKMGAIRGLSIGYSIPKGGAEWDDDRKLRELSKIDLWETSLVTFPANPAALVTDVRAALQDGIYPTVRELEKFLRDAGFSKNDAQTIITNGYRTFIEREAEDVLDIETLTDKLRGITHD